MRVTAVVLVPPAAALLLKAGHGGCHSSECRCMASTTGNTTSIRQGIQGKTTGMQADAERTWALIWLYCWVCDLFCTSQTAKLKSKAATQQGYPSSNYSELLLTSLTPGNMHKCSSGSKLYRLPPRTLTATGLQPRALLESGKTAKR